jgi:hypothetical protein
MPLMPQGRACLRSLNPLNLKPGLEYTELLARLSRAPYSVIRIEDDGHGIAIASNTCSSSLDLSAFEGIAKSHDGFFNELGDCITRALRNGTKPNCGIPEIDNAILEALRLSRNREALERVKCLHANAYITRILNDASRHYAIIRSLNPCGVGSLILLSGQGIHDLPQSKLGIARLLSQLLPGFIQVEEGWNEYTRLAYLIAKAPKELLPHVASLAGRALSVNGYPEDRIEAYITTEALLSRELGYIAVIDFEGEEPFVVKFPKAPFKPDEA